jgi:predicted ferric reductase
MVSCSRIAILERGKKFLVGDPNIKIIAALVVFAPTISYIIIHLYQHLEGMGGFPSTEKEHGHLANDFGKLSAITMSFFLIPVSKHSIILKAFGIDPNHAIRLHIIAGCLVIFSGLFHGLYWICIWIFEKDESIWEIVFPPAECWTLANDEETANLCNRAFVNLLGIPLGLGFTILGLTSLWWVRRKHYNVFITVHILASVLLLFFLVMHHYKMIFYIAPSVLYYLASSMPVWIESVQSWVHGGIRITKVAHIPNTNDCVEISLYHHLDRNNSMDPLTKYETCCGKFVKICVPEISAIWHPFSIFHSNESHDIKIMFIGTGPFTKQFSERLLQSSLPGSTRPKVLVDGFYGVENRPTQALLHETVVIIAGGVGITSYISMLFFLCSNLNRQDLRKDDDRFEDNFETSPQTQRSKTIILHWICRDEGLIQHFNDSYFKNLSNNFQKMNKGNVQVRIFIHHTKKPSPDNHINQISIEEGDTSQHGQRDGLHQERSKRGHAFKPGSLSWGKKGNLFLNIPQALFLSSVVWGSQWLVIYFTDNFQGKSIVVYTRCYIIVAVFILAIIASLLYLLILKLTSLCYQIISRWNYQKLKHDGSEGIEFPANFAQDEEQLGFSTKLEQADKATHDANLSQNSVKVEHQNGRPDIIALINQILEVEHDIGMFLCIPTFLKQSIKELVNEKQCRGKRCAIYEEISEL